ncbi:MAG TPA: D-2-hydroxyacid dehydrogenase family protein [Acidimicrobiia bacterium]|nr:D-2-hydroxyacid dehydrogenase family protein [Acidimicrobiia bacterium]
MRIAVLDDYQQVAGSLADWSTLEAEIVFFPDHISDRSELLTRLDGFDVVVAMRERTPFPRPVLEGLPDLRLLVTTGSANASIDVKAAQELGIVVSGTGALPHPTGELTMALILTLARGLVEQIGSVGEGGWQVGLGRDLLGSTLGVIGLGRLGSQVARLGQAFGMDVLAWSQNLTRERAAEIGVSPVSMDDLLRRADFVTIHLRLSDRTRGLIGRDELSLMRPDAYLVNTSRGPIVEETPLLEAVQSGVIAGAAVDVFEEEPLPPDHPFRTEPRILATPHIGYVTRESYQVFYEGVVESIEAWRDGEPIRLLT